MVLEVYSEKGVFPILATIFITHPHLEGTPQAASEDDACLQERAPRGQKLMRAIRKISDILGLLHCPKMHKIFVYAIFFSIGTNHCVRTSFHSRISLLATNGPKMGDPRRNLLTSSNHFNFE